MYIIGPVDFIWLDTNTAPARIHFEHIQFDGFEMVFFLVASFEKGQKFILFVRPHVFARRRQNVQAPREMEMHAVARTSVWYQMARFVVVCDIPRAVSTRGRRGVHVRLGRRFWTKL